jgi:chemotaxis protein MotA
MIVAAYIIEGGNLASLIGLTPFMIVLGGTIGATMVSFKMEDVFNIPRLIGQAMTEKILPTKDLLEMFITFSEKSRREGILSLENDIEDLSAIDPLMYKGMKLIIDGTDPEVVKHTISNDIYLYELKRRHESSIFEQAGGFSPTMGIIGTVLGLVNVLGRVTDPSSLGPAIALAFTATLWGISLANLFWLPIGNKIKLNLANTKQQKELVLEAMISIQQGENPSIMKDKLEDFLNEREKIKLKQQETSTSER